MAAPKERKQRWQPTENQRWVVCFTLLFLSLFVIVSIISYYFTWRTDQMGGAVANNGGSVGYKIANLLVGDWFGLLALGVPIVVIILSLRIMLNKKAFWERSIRITLTLMILGSVTLGFFFGTNGSVFGSGLGGKVGIDVARWLQGYIGKMGVALLIFMCWMLFAVFINRRTITAVNNVTRKGVDLLTPKHREEYEDEEEGEEDSLQEELDEVEEEPTITTDTEVTDNDVEFEIVGPEEEAVNNDVPADSGNDGVIIDILDDEDEDDSISVHPAPHSTPIVGATTVGTTIAANSSGDDDFEVITMDGGMDGLPVNSEKASVVPDAVLSTGGMVETTEDGEIQIIRTDHAEDQVGKSGTV